MRRRPRTARVLVLVGLTLAVVGLALGYPALSRGDELLSASYRARWFLLGLLVVPLVFWRGTWGEDRRIPRLRLGTLSPLRIGPSGLRVWLRDLPGVVRSVALALFFLALARPVNTLRAQTADEEGIDLVIALDLSGSMQAVMSNVPPDLERFIPPNPRGVRPTRLDVAKAVIRDFIGRRKTDRIGVVVFGKSAYVLSPPTLDYHLLDQLVSRMRFGLIDGEGTAIGDAVGVGVARLRRSPAKSKAVVLLTDGENLGGKVSPEHAASLASQLGIKLFTIQIGQGEMAEVQDGFDLFGQPRYASRPFPVNPELLRELATKTGGQTYVATDARALEASFHDVLDRLEKTKLEAGSATYEELYSFWLFPGVLLLAADALLRVFVLRRFP